MCVSHTCISVHVSACMYVCTTRLHAHMQRCALTHAMLVGSTRNTLNREQCKHDRNMCGRDSCRRQNPTTHAFTWMLRVDRIYDRTPMRCVDLINNDVSLLLLSAIHCSIYTNSMCCIIAALKLQLQPFAFFYMCCKQLRAWLVIFAVTICDGCRRCVHTLLYIHTSGMVTPHCQRSATTCIIVMSLVCCCKTRWSAADPINVLRTYV